MVAQQPFLTASWQNIAMINYVVPPAVLEPYLPAGTELDTWQGKCFVSVVGFLFENAKLMGYSIPFHRDFEEINLRFYVKRKVGNEVRRGVVFIKEIVPKIAIATIAKLAYNENYVRLSTRHDMKYENGRLKLVAYGWRRRDIWEGFDIVIGNTAKLPEPGSVENFITEHYWGYTKQKDGTTLEYQVAHEPWEIWPAEDTLFLCDTAELYGKEIGPYLDSLPYCAFVAKGSTIIVNKGIIIDD